MSDEDPKKGVSLGMFNRPSQVTVTPGDIVAAALSVIWVVVCAIFYLFARQPGATITFDTLNFVVTVLAVLLPVALIWVAAVAARSVSVVREESRRLQEAMDGLRQNYVELAQTKRLQVTPAESIPRPVSRVPENVASQTPESEPKQATGPTFASSREPSKVVVAEPALELGIPEVGEALSNEDFIRALHFPKTAEDKAGFRSLRLALNDGRTKRLIQSAQDVLTLLSQDGIYMDDLVPDRARPDVWRKFAEGQRGRPIATLGGIRDRNSLSLAAQRMRSDHIFRDSAHHFLRQFDKVFSMFAKSATDAEIAAISDTRTARAFMLLGRVAGTFD